MILPHEVLENDIQRARLQIAEASEGTQPERPKILYHYTNAQGLDGILRNHKFWATHHRFLNDSSELSYGISLYNEIIEEKLLKEDNEIKKDFLRKTLNPIESYSGFIQSYVSCFCERDDLLNQWRVYAGLGAGYAIGIRTNLIALRRGPSTPRPDIYFRKVEYDLQRQKALISHIIGLAFEILDRHTVGMSAGDAIPVIARCCAFSRENLLQYSLFFKNSAFLAEEEWRICFITVGSEQTDLIQYRPGQYGIVPYVALELEGPRKRLPIESITIGPTRDATGARLSLDGFARAQGYPFIKIRDSKIPLRF